MHLLSVDRLCLVNIVRLVYGLAHDRLLGILNLLINILRACRSALLTWTILEMCTFLVELLLLLPAVVKDLPGDEEHEDGENQSKHETSNEPGLGIVHAVREIVHAVRVIPAGVEDPVIKGDP